MAIRIHNANFLYDETRGTYIGRVPLIKEERTIKALKASGIEPGFTGEEFICPPRNQKDLERLMQNLEPIFPNSHSRTPTLKEYETLMQWAGEHNKEFYNAANEHFEVLYDEEKGIYVVNSEFPVKILSALENYPPNFPVGISVREVIEQ